MSEIDAKNYLRSNLWPTGTRVQLLNVPWDADYRDVVAWKSGEARDQWFEEHLTGSWFETNFNYLWPNQPVAVPVPYSSAYKYNYIAVTNPAQPVDDEGPVRTYYYFITDVQYLSPQASNLMVQLDVMTTYVDSIHLGRSFVERGHIMMANQNVTKNNYFDYFTLPEGLDVGREYIPTHREYFDLAGRDEFGAFIIVVSTADLSKNPGTVSSPDLSTAKGGVFDGFPNGASLYAIPAKDLADFMSQMSEASWVSQCIIDLYLVPGALVDISPEGIYLFGNSSNVLLFTNIATMKPSDTPEMQNIFTIEDVHDKCVPHTEKVEDVPDKMKCYPYSVIEIGSFTGNPVYLKPEYLQDVVPFMCYGFGGQPSPRFVVFPNNYQAWYQDTEITYETRNMWGEVVNNTLRQGMGLESACILQNFPHITLVNNNYQLYLASNANRLAYNYGSAGWGLARSNMAADTALGIAQMQQDAYKQNYNTQLQSQLDVMNMQAANTGYNTMGSTASDLIGALAPTVSGMDLKNLSSADVKQIGGAAGASLATNSNVLDMMFSAMGMQNTNYMTAQNIAANQRDAASAIAQRNLDTSRAISDTNNALAKSVARGDYQNAIAGINAAVEDAELTPPSTIGQLGGEAFNWKNSLIGITVTWKTIAGAPRQAVKEYFNRYGYKVQRWLLLGEFGKGTLYDLLCMKHFAYWKLLETTLTAANANEAERMAIRGVFEKGVTLWDKPESIATVPLNDNSPRLGYAF